MNDVVNPVSVVRSASDSNPHVRRGVEVTPEMIEAGGDVIWRGLGGCELLPSVRPDELAKEVFEAMAGASQTLYVA